MRETNRSNVPFKPVIIKEIRLYLIRMNEKKWNEMK